MSRSLFLSIVVSVLLLGIFTLISQEYRSAAIQTGLERPRIAAATAASTDAPVHESTTPVTFTSQTP